MKKFSKWKIYFLFIYNNYYTHLKLLISFYFFCIFLLFLVVSEIHSYFNKNVVCFILFINFFYLGDLFLLCILYIEEEAKIITRLFWDCCCWGNLFLIELLDFFILFHMSFFFWGVFICYCSILLNFLNGNVFAYCSFFPYSFLIF